MLGDNCKRVYEEFINTLGNLTLTAYNPELSDAPFAEKKAHFKGGFDQDYLVIPKGCTTWTCGMRTLSATVSASSTQEQLP